MSWRSGRVIAVSPEQDPRKGHALQSAGDVPGLVARSRWVLFICGALGVTGAAALAWAAAVSGRENGPLTLLTLFTAELAVLQVFPIALAHAEEGEELRLEEALFVPMVLLLSPVQTVAGFAAATLFGQLWGRSAPSKAIFNVGQTMTAAATGTAVFLVLSGGAPGAAGRVLSGGAPGAAGRVLVAAGAGGLVYAALSSLAVAAVISIAGGTSFRRTLLGGALVRVATWGGSLSLGVLIFAGAQRHWWIALLSAPPIVALQFGYTSALRELRERRRAERLYEAAVAIRSSVDEDEIRTRLLSAARVVLEARAARFVEADMAQPEHSLRSEVEAGLALEVSRPAAERRWRDRDRQLLSTLAELTAGGIERARLFEEVKRQSLHDPLTGLPNQVLFEDRVTQALALAARDGHRLAVLFVDVDHFKRVNDSFGHAAGDQLLREVGARIVGAVRSSDTVARMGGDEFTLLMPSIGSVEAATVAAEKILALLRGPYHLAGQEIFSSVSIGIAVSPEHGTRYGVLLQNGDLAMYEAKARGRANCQLYQPSMSALTQAQLALENDLRQGLRRDELVVAYQPQFEIGSGAIVGVEALVRWQHPKLGLLGPDRFIPLAEDTGLVRDVDEWVLRTACTQAAAWLAGGLPPLRIGVNLSTTNLERTDLADSVLDIVRGCGLPPSQLELEVTESAAAREGSRSQVLLRELRQHGVRVAIDDFGTGYSSLARVQGFPVDTLKIDKSFVQSVKEGNERAPLVAAIIVMAHSLGLDIVAEGVETEEQLAFLREHACDKAQGYLLGRPVPAARIEELLAGS